MIVSRISSKAQTTIPRAVRAALALHEGDDLAWEIEGNHVVIRRATQAKHPLDNPFATFGEWEDELDSAYDNL